MRSRRSRQAYKRPEGQRLASLRTGVHLSARRHCREGLPGPPMWKQGCRAWLEASVRHSNPLSLSFLISETGDRPTGKEACVPPTSHPPSLSKDLPQGRGSFQTAEKGSPTPAPSSGTKLQVLTKGRRRQAGRQGRRKKKGLEGGREGGRGGLGDHSGKAARQKTSHAHTEV